MALPESWHVRSRSRECAATQRAFTDGETIVTALFPDPESSGYLRRDYCLDAWKSLPADAEKPFSFWKTTFSAPSTVEATDHAERLSPEELLVRLVEEDEDHTENTRYVLAVMLERQKLLRETDHQRTPNGILRVYEHRKTGEICLIRDPDIPLSQVEAVQNEVFLLLENNGRMPEPPAEEPPAETNPEAPATQDPETTAPISDTEPAEELDASEEE
jgi:hypothetical protein